VIETPSEILGKKNPKGKGQILPPKKGKKKGGKRGKPPKEEGKMGRPAKGN